MLVCVPKLIEDLLGSDLMLEGKYYLFFACKDPNVFLYKRDVSSRGDRMLIHHNNTFDK